MTTQNISINFRVEIISVDPSLYATSCATPRTVYKIYANSPLTKYEDRYLGTVAKYGRSPLGWQIIDFGRDETRLLIDSEPRHNLNGDWYDTRAEAVQDLVLRGRLAML
jgi:hypothetical protein|tara:strand:+ start:34268 stop:34594 length:327 start_codon:yes stop_codon:yes gene_type:complete